MGSGFHVLAMDIPDHLRMGHVEEFRQFSGLEAHPLHHGAHGPVENNDVFF